METWVLSRDDNYVWRSLIVCQRLSSGLAFCMESWAVGVSLFEYGDWIWRCRYLAVNRWFRSPLPIVYDVVSSILAWRKSLSDFVYVIGLSVNPPARIKLVGQGLSCRQEVKKYTLVTYLKRIVFLLKHLRILSPGHCSFFVRTLIQM